MRAAMFDNLSKSMEKARRLIGKSGTLTAENMKEPLKEVGEGVWGRGRGQGQAGLGRGRGWGHEGRICRRPVLVQGSKASAVVGCVAGQYSSSLGGVGAVRYSTSMAGDWQRKPCNNALWRCIARAHARTRLPH